MLRAGRKGKQGERERERERKGKREVGREQSVEHHGANASPNTLDVIVPHLD